VRPSSETYNTKQVNSGINPSLYSWERQKETYAKGKLEQEQIQKLGSDFNWTYKLSRETKDKWDIRFERV
jgi:hypothetical protein